MRFLLREVALRLSGIPGALQRLHTPIQRVGHPLQRLNTSVGRPLRPREQPTDTRGYSGYRSPEQLGGKRREIKVMHEASMGPQQGDDTHANGAYIIGMTRLPAPPAGMFETTVLFGHTSTVAPSDVPSVFNSG